MKFYAPMIAKIFDVEESNQYDNMNDEDLKIFMQKPELIDLSKDKSNYIMH
jgi:hypothetical protein